MNGGVSIFNGKQAVAKKHGGSSELAMQMKYRNRSAALAFSGSLHSPFVAQQLSRTLEKTLLPPLLFQPLHPRDKTQALFLHHLKPQHFHRVQLPHCPPPAPLRSNTRPCSVPNLCTKPPPHGPSSVPALIKERPVKAQQMLKIKGLFK